MTSANQSSLLDSTLDFVCLKRTHNPEDVKSKRRFREITTTRHIFFYLVRKYFNSSMPLSLVGSYLNRDHSTVIHGIECIEALKETDRRFAVELAMIEDEYLITTVEAIKRKTRYQLSPSEYIKMRLEVSFHTERANQMYYEALKLLTTVDKALLKDNVIEGFRKAEIEKVLLGAKVKLSQLKMEKLD